MTSGPVRYGAPTRTAVLTEVERARLIDLVMARALELVRNLDGSDPNEGPLWQEYRQLIDIATKIGGSATQVVVRTNGGP